jgi:Tfp pilus assembly protein PilN
VGRGDVTRFDFLHDGLPDAFERIRSMRVPRRLHSAAAAFGTVVLALVAASAIEAVRTNQATALQTQQQARLDAVRARLAAADVELADVARLVETDRRVRAARASGAVVVAHLVRLGNLVPRGVWLSSLEPSPQGLEVEGEAVDVDALHRALAGVVADGRVGRTRLVRMARVPRPAAPALVDFTLSLQAQP